MNKKSILVIGLLINIFFIHSSTSNAESSLSLENGLRISSADVQHKFHLGGYMMFDAILQDDSALNSKNFDLFNAWLHIVGTSYKNFHYKVQYSLEDSNGT